MYSYFENGIKTIVPTKTIDLPQLVKLIKHNPQQSLIENIRKLRLKGDESYKKKKEKLSYITPNCIVKYRKIKELEDYNKNFISSSSYIYFDFDGVENAQEYKEYFISKYKHLVSLVCLSSSCGGISVLIKLTNTVDNTNFFDIWDTIRTTHLKDEEVDINCKNLGRAMYLSYDTEPYVNFENEITVDIQLKNDKKISKKELNQSILYKKEINILNEPLTFIPYEEFISKVRTKTPVEVNKPIVDVFAAEKMDITFPNRIQDGDKHKIYTILIHKLVYLNAELSASYIFSYLNFINNNFGKPPMEFKKLIELFTFVYTSIIGDENYEYLNKKYKYIHFNNQYFLTSTQKRKIASKINGKRKINTSIERIMSAKKELTLQGIKITQKSLALKTGLSISTIKRHVGSIPVDMGRLIEEVNKTHSIEENKVDYDGVFLLNDSGISPNDILTPESPGWNIKWRQKTLDSLEGLW